MKKFVSYLPQFNGFGIAGSEIKVEKGLFCIELSDADYKRFGGKTPAADAPIIGILMGYRNNTYVIYRDYVQTLAHSGVRIVFLDYDRHLSLLNFCDGLLLPGGDLDMPEWYYSDAKPNTDDDDLSPDCIAYIECFQLALAKGMPILGIDDGMQIIAAALGLKLHRSQKYVETPLSHNTPDSLAHHVDLVKDTPFYKLMDKQWRLPVNSRHTRLLAPVRTQRELLELTESQSLPLEVYAFATDGIPEALGNMQQGLLGVQWHPENYAASGDKRQQHIFEWLAQKAKYFKDVI